MHTPIETFFNTAAGDTFPLFSSTGCLFFFLGIFAFQRGGTIIYLGCTGLQTLQYVLHEFWLCLLRERVKDPERPHVDRFRPGPLHREGQHMRADPASPVRAREASLIAELFLSANIPAPFLPNPDGSPNNSVESKLLFDFSYIRKPEYYERIVSLNIREPPFTQSTDLSAHVTASPFLLLFSLFLSRFVPDVAARPFPLPSFGAFRQHAGIVLFHGALCILGEYVCASPPPPPPVNLYRSSASHLTARFSLTHLILNAQLNNSENLQIADDDFQETHDADSCAVLQLL